MGNKLFIVGITCILALPLFGVTQTFVFVGACLMVAGAVLSLLDK